MTGGMRARSSENIKARPVTRIGACAGKISGQRVARHFQVRMTAAFRMRRHQSRRCLPQRAGAGFQSNFANVAEIIKRDINCHAAAADWRAPLGGALRFSQADEARRLRRKAQDFRIVERRAQGTTGADAPPFLRRSATNSTSAPDVALSKG